MDEMLQHLKKISEDSLQARVEPKVLRRALDLRREPTRVSRTPDGFLTAWVQGGDTYAVAVRPDGTGLKEWRCTCPYEWEGPCKHVVALALAGAAMAREGKNIPLLRPDDELYLELFPEADGNAAAGLMSRLRTLLEGKSREELIERLLLLLSKHPSLEQELLAEEAMASDDPRRLEETLHRAILRATRRPAWYNAWKEEGWLPDYSPVRNLLERLRQLDRADAIVEAGDMLWQRGKTQVEQSDDEGVTAAALADCLQTVVLALPRSSLSRPKQVLWLLTRMLDDDFSLWGAGQTLLDADAYTPEDWQEVARALERMLAQRPRPQSHDFTEGYRRQTLVRRLIQAYERGGRAEDVLSLYEREADSCGLHTEFLDYLLTAKRRDQARQYCIRVYGTLGASFSGVAGALRKRLRDMAESDGQPALACAYAAEEFFDGPTLEHYQELARAAGQAACWPGVRTQALRYLETGRRPEPGQDNDWPLPPPEVSPAKTRYRRVFPRMDELIIIALWEERPDDAITLYRTHANSRALEKKTACMVATAAIPLQPELSVEIWEKLAEECIDRVCASAYSEATRYLRRIHDLYETRRQLPEWHHFLAGLRARHKAKRRLQAELDTLPDSKALPLEKRPPKKVH